MDTGLRHRLKRVVRQMADQHRHLRVIHAELAEALSGRGAERAARESFAQYRQALDAHFALESDTFFPAVHGLHADWADVLEGFDRAHERLRDALGEIGDRIDEGSRDAAARALADFTAELRDHEAREEELLAGLAGALGGGPGAPPPSG